MTNTGNIGVALADVEQRRVLALMLAIESITNMEQPRTGSNYRRDSTGAEYVNRAAIFEKYIETGAVGS